MLCSLAMWMSDCVLGPEGMYSATAVSSSRVRSLAKVYPEIEHSWNETISAPCEAAMAVSREMAARLVALLLELVSN